MKTLLSLAFFTFFFVDLKAQSIENSEFTNQNCETFSLEMANFLSEQYFFINKQFDFESTMQFIDHWEQQCGLSEPAIRFKVLLFMQHDKNTDSLINTYNILAEPALVFRINHQNSTNTDSIFNVYKNTLGYIPFNHDFDAMCVAMAQKQIEKSRSIKASVFLNQVIQLQTAPALHRDSQNLYPKNNTFNNNPNEYQLYHTIGLNFSMGTWTPFDVQTTGFSTIAYIGMSIDYLEDSFYIELDTRFRLHNKEYRFDFEAFNDVYEVESSFGFYSAFKLGFRIFKIGPLSTYLNGALGVDLTQTDLVKKTIYDEENDAYYDRYFYLATMHASAGAMFLIKTNNPVDVGIEFNLHKLPYKNDSRLKSNLPNSAFSTGLFLRF